MKTKVLVLGNDPQINDIDFSRLDPSIITLGVNRIWLKHLPNYFFFHDWDIVVELKRRPELLAKLQTKSTIFTSDWYKFHNKAIPRWTIMHPRPTSHRRSFPDSVTTAMWLFKNYYARQLDCVYYIAGVSLKWQNPSHFWKTIKHHSKNDHGSTWYTPRFDKTHSNFKALNSSGYSMISVNPNSRLNSMMRSVGIENLYLK